MDRQNNKWKNYTQWIKRLAQKGEILLMNKVIWREVHLFFD